MNASIFLRLYNHFWGSSPELIFKYRNKAQSAGNGVLRLYYTFRYYKALSRFNSEIPLSAKFFDCPVFPHGIKGVFISSGATIGKDCCIFQQVTIGSNTISGSKGYGAPVIGNNCLIGAGAKIIGRVVVGNNVRIGANCVVVNDIPDNCTVVMNKPRTIINEMYRDNSFSRFEKAECDNS